MSVGIVVLAAGKGTRMKTGRAKVLHEAAGRTLLGWVLAAVEPLHPTEIVVVVGHEADEVSAACQGMANTVVQEPQNGTGHATVVGLGALKDPLKTIVVVPGDMPLIRSQSLVDLVGRHEASGAAATILSVVADDPTGYGRIIRSDGSVAAVVEEADATESERSVSEVNTSVYVFNGRLLEDALNRIGNSNAQGEYYLTDVVGVLVGDGNSVEALSVASEEGIGVNTQAQLAEVAAVLRERINHSLLESGVWMLDPSRVYVDAGATAEPGSKLYPETYLCGSTTVATGAEVGPNVRLTDTEIGPGARIQQAVAVSASVGADAMVGPFAYLRPGAVLQAGAKVGTYVEVKGSVIGEGSKVPHLSYIGDATIGKASNVGAGTITVNYDGFHKHKTVIGDRVRIGSDTMLVAPVTIGNDAYTGAGSVVTHDVPDGALAVERGQQKNVDGYAQKRKQRAEGDVS